MDQFRVAQKLLNSALVPPANQTMSVSLVIPARLESTRLRRKLLLPLGDRPVIQHTWERACRVKGAGEVIVATDSDEIRELIEGLGGRVEMTSPSCQSGTERIISIMDRLNHDFVLNIQGDEPMVDLDLVERMIQHALQTGCDLVTAVTPIEDPDDLFNPNVVKAVRSSDGRALYFTRAACPHYRGQDRLTWAKQHPYWRHLGIYGYQKKVLQWYAGAKASVLESIESLEQLRFIDHGWRFETVEAAHTWPGIDTQDDLTRASEMLAGNQTATSTHTSPDVHYTSARTTVYAEIESLERLLPLNRLSLPKAVDLVLNRPGKVVVTGLGKSGIIARKISATLTSTGTPSVYLSASEALHGDVGMVTPGDVVIMLSKSGTTAELTQMVPALERIQVPIIGIFGDVHTDLAQRSTVVLEASVLREACPLDLAPTASTTMALVLGDALAMALMKARSFVAEQFAVFHPAGALGRRLLLRARDVMHTGSKMAVLSPESSVKDVLVEMTSKALGAACVCDDSGRLLGLITEGDVRRHFLNQQDLSGTARQMMNPQPTGSHPDELLSSLLTVMENGKRQLSAIPVLDPDGLLVGIVRIHDIVNLHG